MANCIVCGEKLSELAVFHNMPASAQDFPRKEDLERERPVDLPLCQCLHCGLVQFDTEPVPYYKDVIRAGGGTTTMRRLREEEYTKLLSYLHNKGQKEPVILELGSGQGEFLKMWEGVDCGALTPYTFGIEHSEESLLRFGLRPPNVEGDYDFTAHTKELSALGFEERVSFSSGIEELYEFIYEEEFLKA